MITTEIITVRIDTTLVANVIQTNLVSSTSIVTSLATVGPQGPQGLQGPPGDVANADNFFQVANKFSELDTPQKKIDARTNLELQYIDCGEFS
jgi:hypothetical protein